MRLNKYIAQATGLSRRAADTAIADRRVLVNEQPVKMGQDITDSDKVTLDGKSLQPQTTTTTLRLHKPAGYVCSRDGQGSPTVYELLPPRYHSLKLVGRLDKDSSGLILLTDDGQLAYRLTHPKFEKPKVYQVTLGRELTPADEAAIRRGIELDDGVSRLQIRMLTDDRKNWQINMREGRNRQIRRTFADRGYMLSRLHRQKFGDYQLGDLVSGKYEVI